MGGLGSGRRWHYGSASTVDQFRRLDIRGLAREGMLEPGKSCQWGWKQNDRVTATVSIRAKPGQILLDYRTRQDGGGWQDMNYPVRLTSTACHLGGTRQWFLCPASGCGRRVAMLYGGTVFACRHCHRLAYPSQREGVGERASRRADQLRERLGWPYGILEGGGWGKPKGMHWRTYNRLCEEYADLENRIAVDFLQRFGDLEQGSMGPTD